MTTLSPGTTEMYVAPVHDEYFDPSATLWEENARLIKENSGLKQKNAQLTEAFAKLKSDYSALTRAQIRATPPNTLELDSRNIIGQSPAFKALLKRVAIVAP